MQLFICVYSQIKYFCFIDKITKRLDPKDSFSSFKIDDVFSLGSKFYPKGLDFVKESLLCVVTSKNYISIFRLYVRIFVYIHSTMAM